MRSTSAVASFAIVAAAAPAFAAPMTQPLNARVEDVGELASLAKDLGKGILTGGAFTGVADAAEHFLGGGSSSAAAPAATPASKRQLTEDDVELLKRALSLGSLGSLGKDLGKGLLTGGAFAGVADAAEHFLGGGSPSAAAPASTPASKRQFTEEDVELLKRAFSVGSLGSLGKDLGKGLLTGGAFAGIADAAENFLGGGSPSAAAPASTPAPSKREIISDDELMRRGFGSILGKLVGATEDDLPTVIKNALAGGVASGAAIGVTDGALNSTKREVDARSLASSLGSFVEGEAGSAIKSGLVNGIGSAIGGTAIGALLGEGKNSTRRDLDDRSIASSLGSLLEGEAGSAIKSGLVNGLGSAIGGTAIGALLGEGKNSTRRALSADEQDQLKQLLTRHLNSREPEPLSSIGKGLIGTGVGLVGSTLGQDAIDEVEKIFKREPEPLSSIGKGLIGTGVGLIGSTLGQDAIDEVEKIFKREIELD